MPNQWTELSEPLSERKTSREENRLEGAKNSVVTTN